MTDLFGRHSAAFERVTRRVADAPVREAPYPHIVVDDVFPQAFYAELRDNWPSADQLVSLGSTGRVPAGAYSERFIMALGSPLVDALPERKRAFWQNTATWMLSGGFLNAMLQRFERHLHSRSGDALRDTEFVPEVLVVRDHTNYELGPHTDSTSKVLSMLFYCPPDDSMKHLGTSMYVPIEPDFRCAGGPHYPFDRFTKVATMEYRQNALFAFFKTDRSFHGVEPINTAGVARDLLLYDVRVAPR